MNLLHLYSVWKKGIEIWVNKYGKLSDSNLQFSQKEAGTSWKN